MHACRAAGFGEESRGGGGLLEVSEEASPRTLGTRKNWKPEGRWGMRGRLPVHARKEFFRHPSPSSPPLYPPLPSTLAPPPCAPWRPLQAVSHAPSRAAWSRRLPALGPARSLLCTGAVEECGARETLMRWEPPTHPCSLPSMGNSAALSRVASAGLSTCSPYIMPGRGSSYPRWVRTGQTGSVPAVIYPISKDLAPLPLPLLPPPFPPPPNPPRRNEREPRFCTYGTTSFCDG